MAKLNYKADLVDDALTTLATADSKITKTDADLINALQSIVNARGIEHVDISGICTAPGLGEQCSSMIQETITGINARVEMVKQYNDDIDHMGIGQRLFSTVALAGGKFIEGVATAGEQIVDGFMSGVGFLAGFISKDAQNSIGNFVKKQWVADTAKNIYESTGIAKASYIKEDGIVATGMKIVGTAVGYSMALSATANIAGGAASVFKGADAAHVAATIKGSVHAGAALAFEGGLGAGTEVGLIEGKTYNQAFGKGVVTGGIAAGMVYAVNYLVKTAKETFKDVNKAKGGNGPEGSGSTPEGSGSTPEGTGPEGTGSRGTGPEGKNAGDTFDGGSRGTGKPGPEGTGTTPSGDAAGTIGKAAGRSADDILNAAGKSADDMVDDLIRAVEKGEVSPEDAMAALNKRAGSALTKAEKIQWHPDKFQARIEAAGKIAAGKGAPVTPEGTGPAVTPEGTGPAIKPEGTTVTPEGTGTTANAATGNTQFNTEPQLRLTDGSTTTSTTAQLTENQLAIRNYNAAVEQQAGLLDDLARLKQTGTATPSQITALENQIYQLDERINGELLSRIAETRPVAVGQELAIIPEQTTALAVIPEQTTALAVVPEVVTNPGTTALAVVPEGTTALAPIVNPGTTALAPIVETPTAIAPIVEAVVEPPVITPAVTPSKVIIPGPITWRDKPVVEIPRNDPVQLTPQRIDVPDTPQVLYGPPSPQPVTPVTPVTPVNPQPQVLYGPPSPQPVTPVTPDPVTPVLYGPPTPPQPGPDYPVYVPIPNTGVSGGSKGLSDYVKPAAIGAFAGLVTGLSANAVRKHIKDDDDEEDDEDREKDK